MNLPDILDTYLPTSSGRKLMMSLLLAHHSKMLAAARQEDIESTERYYLMGEVRQVESVVNWFEGVPVRP